MAIFEQVLEGINEGELDIISSAFIVKKDECKIIEHAESYEIIIKLKHSEKIVYLDKAQKQVGNCNEYLIKEGFDFTPFNP